MSNFVLIHGAWHGGWCWGPVAERLKAQGHRVLAPTLTGLADRSHLLTTDVNMDTHILDVVNAVRWAEFDNFVLCGHSYGGAVITGTAEKLAGKVHAIVYLDALLPVNGQSACAAAGIAAPEGDSWPPVPASKFGIRDLRDEEWVNRLMTPHPIGTITQPLRLSGAHEQIPTKVFVLAAKYRPSPFHQIHEQLKKLESWTALTIDSGHHLMLDAPDLVVDILIDASLSDGTDRRHNWELY